MRLSGSCLSHATLRITELPLAQVCRFLSRTSGLCCLLQAVALRINLSWI